MDYDKYKEIIDNYFKNSTIGEIIDDITDAGYSVVDIPDDEYINTLEYENKKLRKMMFFAHLGCGHVCYGDDGELQCNTCRIDFKRDSIDVIENKIIKANMDKLSNIEQGGIGEFIYD